MAADRYQPVVFSPRTLGDLVTLKGRKPEAEIYAGGTYLLHGDARKYPRLPGSLVSVRHIEDLKRIHRTERYLEVGACVSFSHITRIGGKAVPSILNQAIDTIGTVPVRSLATIGGNICVRSQRLTTFPVLFLLDARVELRGGGGARWVPVSRLASSDGELDILPTEVLTRIRIPLGDWNIQIYRSLSDGPRWNQWTLSFCGLANVDRDVLSDFRFSYGALGKHLLRNREIEAELVSRKLPIPERERNVICQDFNGFLESTYSGLISSYQQSMASKLFRWFLSSLDAQ